MPKQLIKNRSFVIFMTGNAISKFGDNMQRFAFSLYVLNVTHSALQFSIALMLAAIPQALVQPFAGVFADIVDRKRIMVFFDLLSAALTAFFVVTFYTYGKLSVSMIYALVFALSISAAAEGPAANAVFPSIVDEDQYVAANSVDSAVNAVCNFGSPVISAAMYGIFGIVSVALFNSISFIVSALCRVVIFIPKPERKDAITCSLFFRNMKDGFSFVKSNHFIAAMIVLILSLNLSLCSVSIGIPVIVREVFHASNLQLGIVNSFASLALLAGSVLAGVLLKKVSINHFMVTASGILSLYCILFTISSIPSGLQKALPLPAKIAVLSAIYFFYMGTTVIINILFNSNLLKICPAEKLGRVGSCVETAAYVSIPIGQMLFGALYNLLPAYIVMLTGAAFIGVSTLLISQSMLKKHSSSTDTVTESR